MLIMGDVATIKSIELKNILLKNICDEYCLFNLEGGIINSSELLEYYANNYVLFNRLELFEDPSLNDVMILSLANNHFFDDEQLANFSLNFFKQNKIRAVGAFNENIDLTAPVHIIEKGIEISIICLAWDACGCFSGEKFGVNLINIEENILLIREEKKRGRRVLVFLHWGYELENIPLPADVELARTLIDNGADGIIGCHSHCIQPYENYKKSIIYYGLGNFFFDHNFFFKGKLKYPNISKEGLMLRYNPIDNSFSHYFINSMSGEKIESPSSELLDLTDEKKSSYLRYYKCNRRKKNFLPVFETHQEKFLINSKKRFLKLRNFVLSHLYMLGIKKGPK